MLTRTTAQRTEQLTLFAPQAKPTPTIAILPYRWGGSGYAAIAILQGSDRWDYPMRLPRNEADALLAKCGKEVSRLNLSLDEHGRPKDAEFLHRAIEYAFNRIQLEERWTKTL